MKANTNDTDSLFEKSFTKYFFDSEKKSRGPILYSDMFLKGAVNYFAILFWARIYLNNILHI